MYAASVDDIPGMMKIRACVLEWLEATFFGRTYSFNQKQRIE
jgi:hypothetical protein